MKSVRGPVSDYNYEIAKRKAITYSTGYVEGGGCNLRAFPKSNGSERCTQYDLSVYVSPATAKQHMKEEY